MSNFNMNTDQRGEFLSGELSTEADYNNNNDEHLYSAPSQELLALYSSSIAIKIHLYKSHTHTPVVKLKQINFRGGGGI